MNNQDLLPLRHTTSHVLAQAVKHLFPDAKLAIGPAIENGFYYDFDTEHRFTDEDLSLIEKEMKKIVKQNLKLERSEIPRQQAIDLFKDEPYKLELIDAIPEDQTISTYQQGDFIDLCAGPHVESTGLIKAFKLQKIAGAYWRGDEHNKMLQRIYGTAFNTREELDQYLQMLRDAEKYDHRKLGRDMLIFSLSDEAPGEPFFLPNGMIVLNELLKYWREVHQQAGYLEVRTPIILKRHLWETSGHWDHYSQGMYALKVDDEDYAIKPMNCPGGILAFKELLRYGQFTHQDAIRLGEIGLVHRAERSGQLHGLMRVREFTQDDAHIFCTLDNLKSEIDGVIKLMEKVYSRLNLNYELELSTRPENSIGDDSVWQAAETALQDVLDSTNRPFKVNPGDGAFYGPKIDVHIKDSLGRRWQCGTVQLDFNLPERFDVKMPDGSRAVMLHRVIFGSIERFIGILLEHFKGRLPFWLAPQQVRILPVTGDFIDAAKKFSEEFSIINVRVAIDARNETIGKKVRQATLEKVSHVIVFGEKESNSEDISVRYLDGSTEVFNKKDYIKRVSELINQRL
ncbi:MAG: threonine--tRNA ligase [Selenomonadaceae bacterium]|nr:threonine--tRNA ligase [Selenomonadaceae bacterium]